MVEKTELKKVNPDNPGLGVDKLNKLNSWFYSQEQPILKVGEIIELNLNANGTLKAEILVANPPKYEFTVLADFDAVNDRTFELMKSACKKHNADSIKILVCYKTVTVQGRVKPFTEKLEDDTQFGADSFLLQLLKKALPQ